MKVQKVRVVSSDAGDVYSVTAYDPLSGDPLFERTVDRVAFKHGQSLEIDGTVVFIAEDSSYGVRVSLEPDDGDDVLKIR